MPNLPPHHWEEGAPEPDDDDSEGDRSPPIPQYQEDSLTRHGGDKQSGYFVASRFQGHLPSPDLLRDYEQVLPGVAERIVVQMEANGAHRRFMDRATLFLRQGRSYLGLGAGLFIVLKFLDFSYKLIVAGHDVAGTVLGTVDLVALATVFVGAGRTYRNNKTNNPQSSPALKKPESQEPKS